MRKWFVLLCAFLCSCSNVKVSDNDETIKLAIDVGALDKAAELLIQDLDTGGFDIDRSFILADVYYRKRKFTEEFNTLDLIRKRISNVDKNKKNKLDYLILRNYVSRGYFKLAIEQYKKFNSSFSSLSNSEHGKSIMYYGISLCKINDLDGCIHALTTAKGYIPNDIVLERNIKLAYWLYPDESHLDQLELLDSFNSVTEQENLPNLILSAVKTGNYDSAFWLLQNRYSVKDAQDILDDLKRIRFSDKKN